jgi:hypothetical protein
MDAGALSYVVNKFKVAELSTEDILLKLGERADLIKPLLKQATLQRLGKLGAFGQFVSHANPCIQDCDLSKSKRMLNIQTEGIFGLADALKPGKKLGWSVSKYWGLCRDLSWCYGRIEFERAEDSVELISIDFYTLSLEQLLDLWPDWQSIWKSLTQFVVDDYVRAKKRFALSQHIIDIVQIENAPVERTLK